MSAAGQEQTPWQTVVGRDNEFSVSLPGEILVNKNPRWKGTTIVGGGGGVGYELTLRRPSKGDEITERQREAIASKWKESEFNIGEARIRISTYETPAIYRTIVNVGTKKGHYYLSLFAQNSTNEVLSSLLASIRLNGQPVVAGVGSTPPTSSIPLEADKLKVGDLVRAALKRKQTERVTVKVAQRDYEPTVPEIVYSRPVLVVSTPFASYSDEARRNNVHGAVRLRIQLKANGNVGTVLVIKGLPHGLTEQAVRAASEIKFVPAEVDGKPADAEVTREYTFWIY